MVKFHLRKSVVVAIIVVLCGIALVNICYWTWGSHLVRAMYEGTAVWPLNRIITFQHEFSLGHYVEAANRALLALDIFLGLLIPGFLGILFRFRDDVNRMALFSILWVDVCFLAAHLTGSIFWDLTRERSFPEVYSFGLELFLATSFFLYFRRSRQPIFLWSSSFFWLVFIDDSLCLHERTSFYLADKFKPAFLVNLTGVVPKHIWEFLIFAIAGAVALSLFVLAYRKSSPEFHRFARSILFLIFAAFFFGSVVDFIHDFPAVMPYHHITVIIEDWGEIVTISLAAYLAFKHRHRFRKPTG